MGLMGAIRSMLFSRAANPEVAASRHLAARISEHAEAIQRGASKYVRSRDPFAAFMADLYNRDEMSRVWRGPPSEPS